MRFETIHPDGDAYDGVVTHIERNHVVLCPERDFEFDGLMVFPKKAIKGYRDSGFESCANKLMIHNGAIGSIPHVDWLDDCGSIKEILIGLKERDIWPAIEVLFENDSESTLHIGPITAIHRTRLSLHCYDAAGNWEKVYTLDFDEIFRIEFDTKYCNHFNAYMRRYVPR